MIARFFYRLFLRVFARRLIKDAYRAILARPADPPGLRAYTRGLRQRKDLGWLIADLLDSGEARGRLGLLPPNELVTQAFVSVLRRAPTKEELEAHTARLIEGQSIGALLSDLSAGRSGSGRIAQDEAEELVRATFRALLHREPEATALAAYTHLLVETGDVTAFVQEVGHSQEHIEKLGQKLNIRPANAPGYRPRAIARR